MSCRSRAWGCGVRWMGEPGSVGALQRWSVGALKPERGIRSAESDGIRLRTSNTQRLTLNPKLGTRNDPPLTPCLEGCGTSNIELRYSFCQSQSARRRLDAPEAGAFPSNIEHPTSNTQDPTS